jgi:hypothetical protein
MQSFTGRIFRRSDSDSPGSRPGVDPTIEHPSRRELEHYDGRWIAAVDGRVVADDDTASGLMRKVWESGHSLDHVRVQFVGDQESAAKAS